MEDFTQATTQSMILRMPRTRSVSVTEAARNFAELVNRAYYKGETVVLMRNGTPVAQLGPTASPQNNRGKDIAAAWRARARMSPEEAAAFERDVLEARAGQTPVRDPWE
jgi:prevent-host-death family protein